MQLVASNQEPSKPGFDKTVRILFVEGFQPQTRASEPDHESPEEIAGVQVLFDHAIRLSPSTQKILATNNCEAACRAFSANGYEATVIGWYKSLHGQGIALIFKPSRAFWFYTGSPPSHPGEIIDVPLERRRAISRSIPALMASRRLKSIFSSRFPNLAWT